MDELVLSSNGCQSGSCGYILVLPLITLLLHLQANCTMTAVNPRDVVLRPQALMVDEITHYTLLWNYLPYVWWEGGHTEPSVTINGGHTPVCAASLFW